MVEAEEQPQELVTKEFDVLVQEYVNSTRDTLRVDGTRGVLRGVKLLGLRSRNGRRYEESALRAAISLYEGSKVNVNHPTRDALAPRDYRDRLGVVRNVQFVNGNGIFGDLHYNPSHPLAEQLVWDAQNAPGNVGLSHNVLARTRRENGELVIEAINRVQSVDLVADPATTAGLFEATCSQQDTEKLITDQSDRGQGGERRCSITEQIEELQGQMRSLQRKRVLDGLLRERGLPSGLDETLLSEAEADSLQSATDVDLRRIADLHASRWARTTEGARPCSRERVLGSASHSFCESTADFVRRVTGRR